MADNIVQGLFGVDPNEINAQRQARIYQQANNYAQQTPMQKVQSGFYQAGANLAPEAMGMLGYVDPAVTEAQQREGILKQADISTSQGALKAAELAKAQGNVKLQIQLQTHAQNLRDEESKRALQSSQAGQADATAEMLRQPTQQTKDVADPNDPTKIVTYAFDRVSGQWKRLGGAGQKFRDPTPNGGSGLRAEDKEFGKQYIDWRAMGGSAGVEKSLAALEGVVSSLQKDPSLTGKLVGSQPVAMRKITNPKSVMAQQTVEQEIQQSLRQVLGAQYTEKEGTQLLARAYDPSLTPADNIKKLTRTIEQLRKSAQAKEDASNYWEKNNHSLQGYTGTKFDPSLLGDTGSTPSNLADLAKAELERRKSK
jgi:hypothetical protein